MPYEPQVDVLQVLKATLSLLEYTDFPTKGSEAVASLKRCLREAIAEIHLATSATSSDNPEA